MAIIRVGPLHAGSSPFLGLCAVRWATNLGGGNTQNGRDSAGRRLGIKKGNGILYIDFITNYAFSLKALR